MAAITLTATWNDEANAVGAGSGIKYVSFSREDVLPTVIAETWSVGTPSDEDDYTAYWSFDLNVAPGGQIKVRSRSTDNDGQVGTEVSQSTINVPEFTNSPDTMVALNTAYSFVAETDDPGSESKTITLETAPAWLSSFTDHGDGTATVSGTSPSSTQSDPVVLRVLTDTSNVYTELSWIIFSSDGGGIVPMLTTRRR